MANMIVWRLPTLKEIGITALIVLPIALILTGPLQRARLKKYPGAIEVQKQLKRGSAEDIQNAVDGILKNPKMIPIVSDEIETALKKGDSEIRILIINTLKTAVPDDIAKMDYAIYVTEIPQVMAQIVLDGAEDDVKNTIASCLLAWYPDGQIPVKE